MSLATKLEPAITCLHQIANAGQPLVKHHGHQIGHLQQLCSCLQKIVEQRMKCDPYKDYIRVLEDITRDMNRLERSLQGGQLAVWSQTTETQRELGRIEDKLVNLFLLSENVAETRHTSMAKDLKQLLKTVEAELKCFQNANKSNDGIFRRFRKEPDWKALLGSSAFPRSVLFEGIGDQFKTNSRDGIEARLAKTLSCLSDLFSELAIQAHKCISTLDIPQFKAVRVRKLGSKGFIKIIEVKDGLKIWDVINDYHGPEPTQTWVRCYKRRSGQYEPGSGDYYEQLQDRTVVKEKTQASIYEVDLVDEGAAFFLTVVAYRHERAGMALCRNSKTVLEVIEDTYPNCDPAIHVLDNRLQGNSLLLRCDELPQYRHCLDISLLRAPGCPVLRLYRS